MRTQRFREGKELAQGYTASTNLRFKHGEVILETTMYSTSAAGSPF